MSTALVPVVHARNGVVFANSWDAAVFFEKRHDNVLQALHTLDCSEAFRELNFQVSTYQVPGQSRSYLSYDLTKDGFAFLVMGFTGSQAAKFKETYIAAFNDMEAQLRAPVAPALPDFNNPNAAMVTFANNDKSNTISEGRSKGARWTIKSYSPTAGLSP